MTIYFDQHGNKMEEGMECYFSRPLTRELLEEFSNRCARLAIYEDGSREKEDIIHELSDEAMYYSCIHNEYDIIEIGTKKGVKNRIFDEMHIPPIYDEIRACYIDNDCAAFIVRTDDKWGLACDNAKNHVLCPCIYDSIHESEYAPDVFIIEKAGKYGVLYITGDSAKEYVPPIYDKITEMGEDYPYILLERNGKYGLYGSGCDIIEPLYDKIFVPLIMGWIKVLLDGQWGYLDMNGQFTTDMNKAFYYRAR